MCNEREVLQRLRRHGFELLEDRPRPVADQVAAFAEAEMIVGPHGAGLANMAWMSPGSTVVELLPDQFAPPFYERLAARLGLEYLAVGGTGPSGTMSGDPSRLFIDPAIHAFGGEDFTVDGGALQLSLFDERDMAAITAPEFPGERLIVCRNPDLARERGRKREALLAATERDLAAIAAAVARQRRPLKGGLAVLKSTLPRTHSGVLGGAHTFTFP